MGETGGSRVCVCGRLKRRGGLVGAYALYSGVVCAAVAEERQWRQRCKRTRWCPVGG